MGLLTANNLPSIPTDGGNHPLSLAPAKTANAQTNAGTLSSTKSISLNAATTFLRCYATSQDVFMKWGTAACTTANFDEVLPVGQIVDFVVPNGVSAINLIERAASGTIVVIEK